MKRSRRGGVRVGLNNSNLRLEIGKNDLQRLPSPISATVIINSEGRLELEFETDSSSTYKWGRFNEEYQYYPVDIPVEKVLFDGPESSQKRFTFTHPAKIMWFDKRLRVIMPEDMLPPRRKAKKASEEPISENNEPAKGSALLSGEYTSRDLEPVLKFLNDALKELGDCASVRLENGRVRIREEIS